MRSVAAGVFLLIAGLLLSLAFAASFAALGSVDGGLARFAQALMVLWMGGAAFGSYLGAEFLVDLRGEGSSRTR